jgi:sporulation protein YunB
VSLVLVVIVGFIYLLDWVLRPTILAIADVQAVQVATQAANQAVLDTLTAEHVEYSDLVDIKRNPAGQVELLQANTVRISEISAEVTLAVQKSLETIGAQPLEIPLGQILGIQFLAARGPLLPMYLIPVGTVLTNVSDKFVDAGVNQTKHTIYLELSTNVRVVVPLFENTVHVATTMPLAESIIVGTVPSVYVNLPGGILGYGKTP